jgi:aspyridone synthetase trans-acting enoyl reductase
MVSPTTLPATHSALKVAGPGTLDLTSDIALPTLEASDVLVRVACISISPVDCKSADMSPATGATSGTEFSGVVVCLGASVHSSGFRTENNLKPIQIGDLVFGGIFGNNPLRRDNGAFAEYVAVPAYLIWHVPTGMGLATAASLPAALATVGLTLFQHMKLPMPSAAVPPTDESKPWVLVYGGGTATGCMAIQVLKLSGYRPIATCSQESSERAMRLGAEATFDYQTPNCGALVREHTGGTLTLALDCITDIMSMALCYEAIGLAGGKYVALEPFPIRGHTRRSIVPDWVCTYTQFGEPVSWAAPWNFDARPAHRSCAESWYTMVQRLLDEGRIEPHPIEERGGGLSAVRDGMEEVRKGHVKGKKLVYSIGRDLIMV